MNEETSGSHLLSQAILRNYQSALVLVREAIAGFDDSQWRRGELPLQVPWRLAYHVVECLDYYFRQGPGSDFLGHYLYGLRHTMHHHGEMSLLSLQFGNPEGTWQ